MIKFKIYLAFYRLADALLILLVQRIIGMMTGNPNFATPSPTLASVTTLLDNFITACVNAADGGKTLTAIKRQQRALLTAQLRLLASYVENISNNDEAVILSSGFDIYNGPYPPRPVPDAPTNLRLSDGIVSGTIKAKVDVVNTADVYELRFTTDSFGPEARWTNLPVFLSPTKMTISGLTPGVTVWVQVRCINNRGVSNWSDPAFFEFVR
ncbi:MAG: fibronectin type III domain-containing protein [Sphingobacteriales bacterium]|nr:MAG: fibronectin type III domain-containing protein [Sphingobacteriales bacterium]